MFDFDTVVDDSILTMHVMGEWWSRLVEEQSKKGTGV